MTIKKDKKIHTSVLYNELIENIKIYLEEENKNPRIIVDGTLGYAGHALGVIQKMKKKDIFVGFDADDRNLKLAEQRIQEYKNSNKNSPEIILINSNFVNIKEELAKRNIYEIDACYFDLGVSSIHFDEADRGFSFRMNAPLDMRFDTSSGETAENILAKRSEKELADIFYFYGEERSSKKIAEKIVKYRKKNSIKTSFDLNSILDEINPNLKIKTRIYQALRIEVNKELENLEICLQNSIQLLKKNGIIFVISFHSLEDRIVKNIFKKYSRYCNCSEPVCICTSQKILKIITKKPIIPTEEEQETNTRSRSAKARIAKKL